MSFNPALYVSAKVRARQALRAKGETVVQAWEKSQDITNDVIDAAASAAAVTVPASLIIAASPGMPIATAPTGALGTILTDLVTFFTSAAGQQLISAILAIIGVAS